MRRRDFFKNLGLSGALTVMPTSLMAAVQKDQMSVAKSIDMVAVMGSEPATMLRRALQEMGGITKYVKKGDKVVLKPNIGWDKSPEMAANTNPQIVAEMITQCFSAGAKEVIVFDHTCDNWQRSYKNSGIQEAVEKAGGKIIPGNDESMYRKVSIPRGVQLKEAKIHQAILDCDVWFNIPILKHHGGAKMSVSMKNLMGIVWDRGVFHSKDLQQCIADIATYSKAPALNIVDAYRAMKTNGPQGKSEEDVVLMKGLFISPDYVAVDTAAIKFFNQAREMKLSDVSHLEKAQQLKVGTTDLEKLNIKRIKL